MQSNEFECFKLDIVNNLTDFKTLQSRMNIWKGYLIFEEISQIISY